MSHFNAFFTKAPWQRLVLSLVGIFVIQAAWRWAVAHLYTLPVPALAGFVSLTTSAFYVTGAIVIFMVTGRLVYEWRMGTQQIQNVISEASTLKEELIRHTPHPKHFDDDEIS